MSLLAVAYRLKISSDFQLVEQSPIFTSVPLLAEPSSCKFVMTREVDYSTRNVLVFFKSPQRVIFSSIILGKSQGIVHK